MPGGWRRRLDAARVQGGAGVGCRQHGGIAAAARPQRQPEPARHTGACGGVRGVLGQLYDEPVTVAAEHEVLLRVGVLAEAGRGGGPGVQHAAADAGGAEGVGSARGSSRSRLTPFLRWVLGGTVPLAVSGVRTYLRRFPSPLLPAVTRFGSGASGLRPRAPPPKRRVGGGRSRAGQPEHVSRGQQQELRGHLHRTAQTQRPPPQEWPSILRPGGFHWHRPTRRIRPQHKRIRRRRIQHQAQPAAAGPA